LPHVRNLPKHTENTSQSNEKNSQNLAGYVYVILPLSQVVNYRALCRHLDYPGSIRLQQKPTAVSVAIFRSLVHPCNVSK